MGGEVTKKPTGSANATTDRRASAGRKKRPTKPGSTELRSPAALLRATTAILAARRAGKISAGAASARLALLEQEMRQQLAAEQRVEALRAKPARRPRSKKRLKPEGPDKIPTPAVTSKPSVGPTPPDDAPRKASHTLAEATSVA